MELDDTVRRWFSPWCKAGRF